MKEIIKTREVKTNYTVYQAFDGTEFEDCQECLQYEKGAEGMLLARIQHAVVKSDTEYNILGGSDDTEVRVVMPKTKEDIDTITHLVAIHTNLERCPLPEMQIGHPVLICMYWNDRRIDSIWLRTLDGIVADITDGKLKVQYE